MELQRLSLLNINTNRPTSQVKSTRKPTASEYAGKSWQSGETEEGRSQQMEVLISISSTVASSNGIDLSGSHLSFSINEDTGRTVVNIIDNDTGEIIKQIPPEEILKLKKKMGEIQGLLLDRKV